MSRIQQNSESPLLKLPAEIRSRIFQYAVGGRTFQCRFRGVVLSRDQVVQLIDWHLERWHPDFEVRGGDKNVFALLSVCRQIYAETALLPFYTSIFSFSEERALQTFLKSRLEIEREAVYTIQDTV